MNKTMLAALALLHHLAQEPKMQGKDYPPFLRKVLGLLARYRFLHSERGAHGGFWLLLPITQIRVIDVMKLFGQVDWMLECHIPGFTVCGPSHVICRATEKLYHRLSLTYVSELQNWWDKEEST